MMLSHNHLRIHQDVGREYQGRDARVHQFHRAVAREEHGHESEQDQRPQAHEQIRHPGGEIIFRLAGDEGEADEEPRGQEDGFEDDGRLVE